MKHYRPDNEYTAEIDKINEDKWSDLLSSFRDASLYQTWAYGKVRWGEENLSHLVLRKSDAIVAAVQVRIVKIPLLGKSIAYIYKGPLWKQYSDKISANHFRQVLRAIKFEYAEKKKFYISLVPNEYKGNGNIVSDILKNEGFTENATGQKSRTYILNITQTLDELYKGMEKKWRENLRRSRRGLLEIREGNDMESYNTFIKLYKEMLQRKKFQQFVDIYEFKQLQEQLRDDQKLDIIICENNGVPVSAIVWSSIGNTGIPIFSATGNEGRKLRGSYLQRWMMVERLKKKNVQFLDQGGINEIRNPGGFKFKKGMGGTEVEYLDQFDFCNDLLKKILIKFLFRCRMIIQDMKYKANNIKSKFRKKKN